VDLYAKEGLNIFPPGWISGVLQVIEPKYSARGLEFVLQRYFGDTTLREAVVDVLVPAYDIEHRNVMFFRSGMAKTQIDCNYPMRVVARATSAAPTYFPPLSLDGVAGSQLHFTLIDGGVVLNDPAMAAYMDDWAGQAAHPDNVMIVSLGTGSNQTPVTYQQAKRWGLLQWVHPLLDVALDGGPEVTEYWLDRLLHSNYHRFQAPLAGKRAPLDAASPADVAALQGMGTMLLSSRRLELDAVCAQLLETAPRPPVAPQRGLGIRAAKIGLRNPTSSAINSDQERV
jgi:uncharacterized protein